MTDTKRRFEIFVPSPKARINLGKKNDSSTGPFGYDGVSIQSDVHLFIDANKNTLFQTGTDYCGQVGGKWVQYSNKDMVMSATASMNLTADKKIVLATGAGQGQVTALDHGSYPGAIPYNNLGLHYEVEALDVSLFEFFHGRREREERGPRSVWLMEKGAVIDPDDDNDSNRTYFDASKGGTTKEGEGFATVATASLRELFPVADERDIAEHSTEVEPGDPVELIDDLVTSGIFGGSDDPSGMKFGFSGYVHRFDPYGLLDKSKVQGSPKIKTLAKGLVGLLNAMKTLNRFIDVTEKYASLLSDNFLMKRVQAAQGAFNGFAGAFSKAYGVAKLTFGSFDDPRFLGGLADKYDDEISSGIGARLGVAGDGPGAAAAWENAANKRKGKKASIESLRGPWDLSQAAGHITVEWGDKGASPTSQCVIDLGAPTPAVMTLKTKSALPRLMVAVVVDTTGFPAGVTLSEIKAPLAAVLGVTEPELDGADAPNGVFIQPELEVLANILYRRADLDAEVLREEVAAVPGVPASGVTPAQPGVPAEPAITMADIGLTVSHHECDLRVAISGSWSTVRIGTSTLSESRRMGHVLQAALSGLGASSASAYDSTSSSFTVTTTAKGTSASIEIGDSEDWVFESLGQRKGSAEFGQAPLDLTAVTADQLAGRIPAADGLSKSLGAGTFKLEGPHLEDKEPRSWVKVSGAKVEVIFGADPTENEVSAVQSGAVNQGVSGLDASISALKSWSHELGKIPEDARNLTRPLRQATGMLVGAIGGVEAGIQNAVEVIGDPLIGLPSGSGGKSIGLIANGGITLGSTDRLVGVGGKGVVFVCDGGTGAENHKKFIEAGPVKVEDLVNVAMKFDPIDAGLNCLIKKWKGPDTPPADAKQSPGPSLGFRVLSDSTVDLLGTRAAQLLALGRAKMNTDLGDGSAVDDSGIGVVRVAASHATEVAAFRKVLISARNHGTDDLTGGRVELAGQTIAIGAMNMEDAADTQDFDAESDDPRFGLPAIDVDEFAGAEHLSDDEKTGLQKDFQKYAWSETLLNGGEDGHPNTERVIMHAVKETIIQVGTYVVMVRGADETLPGVQIGTRKPNTDPTVNEIDEEKPFLFLDDALIGIGHKDSGAGILLGDNSVIINDEQGGAAVELQGGDVTVTSKDEKGTVKVSSTGVEVKVGSNSLKLTSGGIDAKGSSIKWG